MDSREHAAALVTKAITVVMADSDLSPEGLLSPVQVAAAMQSQTIVITVGMPDLERDAHELIATWQLLVISTSADVMTAWEQLDTITTLCWEPLRISAARPTSYTLDSKPHPAVELTTVRHYREEE